MIRRSAPISALRYGMFALSVDDSTSFIDSAPLPKTRISDLLEIQWLYQKKKHKKSLIFSIIKKQYL
jgi:hypothetical protein